jgi:hypothetical protein
MREVGPGVALERFELRVDGQAFGQVDIAGEDTASLVLATLPEFPLELPPDRARQFVEAWGQRANIGGQPYEVLAEQREV